MKGLEAENNLVVLGWHEPIALPSFGVQKAYAKLDTGADHCVLHAQNIASTSSDEVEFTLPLLLKQGDCDEFVDGGPRRVRAPLVDERIVRSSNGRDEKRLVVETIVSLAGLQFATRFSLTDRRGLRFAVLLGRSALAGRILVDSSQTHLADDAVRCPWTGDPDTRSTKR